VFTRFRPRFDLRRRDTAIDSNCRKVHDRIQSLKGLRARGLAKGTLASTVTGDGSNGSPFVAPCANPALVDCTVTAFETRLLKGLRANEYVPAYRCPSDHPYLTYGRYVPDGVLVPPGDEITRGHPGVTWAIGILISNCSSTNASNGTLGTGTMTGFLNSTATNWSTGTAGYKVILHCTSEPTHAWVTALP
jgi:hypothetical protein